MRIGNREIGINHRPYIIAEIGVNHDGDVERAMSLTDAAADANADAIKLQFFETDRLMSKAAKLAAYQKNAGETDPTEMLRRLELTIDEMARVVERAHSRNIHAIVTVFSTELVEITETIPWDAYKTASPDIINYPLIRALIDTQRPLIISTGAAQWIEVQETYHQLIEPISDRCALLQCVSCYPTNRSDASIAALRALDDEILWRGGALGYSDHTQEIDTGALAVQVGASILEKHFTYDRNAQGPDHGASLEADAMKQYIKLCNDAPRAAAIAPECVEDLQDPDPNLLNSDVAFGPIEKRVLDCEKDVRAVSRQSVVSTIDIPANTTITRDMLTIKRPGTGILACNLESVIGCTTSQPIEADVPINESDLVQFEPLLASV
jgi:N-acetylneuraminate synthase/N,N'-diacetyllegionaminate synthase